MKYRQICLGCGERFDTDKKYNEIKDRFFPMEIKEKRLTNLKEARAKAIAVKELKKEREIILKERAKK